MTGTLKQYLMPRVSLRSGYMHMDYVRRMAKRVRRPSGTPTKGAFFELDPAVKDKIDALADDLNLPTWAVIECAIRAAKPGPDGVPIGWVLPDPTFPDVIDFSPIGGDAILRRTA